MKKNIMPILLLLVCVLALSLTACGAKSDSSAADAAGVDYTLYPETFEEWSIANLKSYLREVGVFEKNEWGFDMSAGDLEAAGATAGTMYVDTEAGTIMDIILYFDPSTETGAAMLDGARADHAVTPVGADAESAIAMDAMMGNFCITYSMGSDTDHISALCQALHDLADHYGITPDYITE